MRIAEFARCTGLSVRALRHYEAQGWLRPAGATVGGHRRYHRDQVVTARVLVALHRAGLPLGDAAEAASARDPALLTAGAEQLEAWARVLRDAVQGPPVAGVLEHRQLPGAAGVVARVSVPVDRVADSVRELRVTLLGGRADVRRRRHPTWPDGPDGPWVELLRPAYADQVLDVRVFLPWPAQREVPPGASRVRSAAVSVHATRVADWERATLAQVHAAHRAVDAAPADTCCRGGRRWQLYDAPMQRMWVARECLSAATPR